MFNLLCTSRARTEHGEDFTGTPADVAENIRFLVGRGADIETQDLGVRVPWPLTLAHGHALTSRSLLSAWR